MTPAIESLYTSNDPLVAEAAKTFGQVTDMAILKSVNIEPLLFGMFARELHAEVRHVDLGGLTRYWFMATIKGHECKFSCVKKTPVK